MTRSRYRWLRGNDGQTLVIFALALAGLLAMVALIIDGGNAFAQQRRTQNGADAAAEAGAVELARRLVGLPGTEADWDGRVLAAVNATATANGLTVVGTPEYTDVDGAVLGPVGTGVIWDGTQGVRAAGSRQFSTYIAGVIGLSQLTASANATAVTGYVDEVGLGGLIPLTFPVILTQCETGGGSNRLVNPLGNEGWPTGPENLVALPLCSNGPGNVGWIDWDPPAGGASDVAASILEPDNGTVTTPKWYFVAETGAITSLDDEMDTWEGKDILLPIFHVQADNPATPEDESLVGTCDTAPTGSQTLLGDCPAGHNGGSGQNQWYFLVTFAKFHLEHSYIQGNHQVECNDSLSLAIPATSGTGNQINNCLIGYFKEPVIAKNASVGSGTAYSNLSPLAIQLIK